MDEDQESKIQEFMTIAQVSYDIAREFLSNHQWDLSTSVMLYLEDPSAFKDDKPPEDHDYVRPPIEPVKMKLVDGPPVIPSARYAKNTFTTFRDLEREQEISQGSSEAKKRLHLADLFRPPHEIIFKGNIQEATRAALTDDKYLLINIQAEDEFNCHRLTRDTWNNGTVKNYLKQYFIFLQVQRESPFASQYISENKVDQFPHIAIINPESFKIVERHDKFVPPEEMTKILEKLVRLKNSDDFMESQVERNILDLTEEEQMEIVKKLSMEHMSDEPSEKKRNFDNDDMNTEQKKWKKNDYYFDSESEEEMLLSSDDISVTNDIISDQVSDDYNIVDIIENLDTVSDDMKSHLRIRLPDGRSVVQVFHYETPIYKVCRFISVTMDVEDNFNLSTTYPRILLERDDRRTLKELKLYPRAAIVLNMTS